MYKCTSISQIVIKVAYDYVFRVAECLIDQVEKSTTKRENAPVIFLVGNKNDLGSLIHEQACTDLRLITDYWVSLSVRNNPADCR